MNYDIEFKMQQELLEKSYYKLQIDRLKKRSFVYSSFPLVSKYSIEMNDLRSFVYSDVHSRYLSYKGNSTLFATGINNTSKFLYDNVSSNILSKDDPYSMLKENSYNDLYSMDIGFDFERKNESHSKDFIYFIQDAFMKLYKFNHITKDDNYYLNFEPIKDIIIDELNKNSMFDELKDYLEYESGLIFEFQTSNFFPIKALIKNPEYISGVNFIAIKGSSQLAKKYMENSEKEYILSALKKKKNIGVFSGEFAINPLTNQEIPIILSNHFKEEIHIGIPNLNNEDLLFSSVLGLSFYNIIEIFKNKKTLVNSHFLDGYTLEEGRDFIIKVAVQEGVATYYEDIKKTMLQISTEYDNGISIPCFEDTIVSKDDLPVLIDRKNKVRTLNGTLSEKNLTNKVFTTEITQAFLSIAARVKSKIGITNYSSIDFLNEIKDFPTFDFAIFHSKEDYLYTLVLNVIVLKSLNIFQCGIINKFHIEGSFYDKSGLEIIRENNNLIDINSIVRKYGACCLRSSVLSIRVQDNYYYNPEELTNIAININKFKNVYQYDIITEFKELEYHYKELLETCTNHLETNNLQEYQKELYCFINKCNIYKKISFRQAKGLLILFSLISPSICEYIYKEVFKSNYPLMYEGWPF